MNHRKQTFAFIFSLAIACLVVRLAPAASLESGNLALSITTAPNQFSFQFLNKTNNTVVLSSSSTAFGAAGVTGVSSTVSGNDGQHDFLNLNFTLAGGGTATGRFTLTSPTTVQVDLTGPASTSAISQMFVDNGEHYYGTWQSLFANLDNRGLNQLYDGTSLSSTSVEGSAPRFTLLQRRWRVHADRHYRKLSVWRRRAIGLHVQHDRRLGYEYGDPLHRNGGKFAQRCAQAVQHGGWSLVHAADLGFRLF